MTHSAHKVAASVARHGTTPGRGQGTRPFGKSPIVNFTITSRRTSAHLPVKPTPCDVPDFYWSRHRLAPIHRKTSMPPKPFAVMRGSPNRAGA